MSPSASCLTALFHFTARFLKTCFCFLLFLTIHSLFSTLQFSFHPYYYCTDMSSMTSLPFNEQTLFLPCKFLSFAADFIDTTYFCLISLLFLSLGAHFLSPSSLFSSKQPLKVESSSQIRPQPFPHFFLQSQSKVIASTSTGQ